MSKRIKFNRAWDWNHFYFSGALSIHNQYDRFCVWFQFLGLFLEIEFEK